MVWDCTQSLMKLAEQSLTGKGDESQGNWRQWNCQWLAWMGSERPFIRLNCHVASQQEFPTWPSGTACIETIKTLGVHNTTQTSKWFPSRTLQKERQTIRIKYEQAEISDRLLTRNYHLRGHLFKLGLLNNPCCEKFQKKDDTASHVPCDCKAFISLRLSPGTLFYRTRLLKRPI
jgi:hypothetical protein